MSLQYEGSKRIFLGISIMLQDVQGLDINLFRKYSDTFIYS